MSLLHSTSTHHSTLLRSSRSACSSVCTLATARQLRTAAPAACLGSRPPRLESSSRKVSHAGPACCTYHAAARQACTARHVHHTLTRVGEGRCGRVIAASSSDDSLFGTVPSEALYGAWGSRRASSSASSSAGSGASSSAGSGGTSPSSSVDEGSEAGSSGGSGRAAESARLRRALATPGQLGLGFSAGGFLYCYHLGVLWELERLGVLTGPGCLPMAGASAGSLAIATYNSGVTRERATQAYKHLAADCRASGTPGRLSQVLRSTLMEYLPADAHVRCSGTCYVAVTKLMPYMHNEMISHFDDREALVDALLTSCHVPVYANGHWTNVFRGAFYIDGGATAFIPSPPTPHVVRISCWPLHRLLETVRPAVALSARLSAAVDNIAVSPDAFGPFEPTYRQMIQWALFPAEDETLEWLVARGEHDAAAWARSHLLVSAPAATAA
ncbi:hypothetical protein FOA52_011103 [Chlamydomonas sp. UWO 241]|nr:hypothetical protein FOA52_011103 [Chlamydomonas sp. UWO 241]